MKPGAVGVTDTKAGWSLENEIAWEENYLKLEKQSLAYKEAYIAQHETILASLYKQRGYWQRLLRFCTTGKHE